MSDINDLHRRIVEIESRNTRVEADKAWETSIFRTSFIASLTYMLAAFLLASLNLPDPYLNALVPTLGFTVSVQSLPFLKRMWIRKFFQKKEQQHR